MKTTIIFDYDGTIHNTMSIYEPAFRRAHKWLIDEGVINPEYVPYERISSWLGLNIIDMWNDFAPDMEELFKVQAGRIIGEEMAKNVSEGKASWYEGAEDTLNKIKEQGYDMVVLSNCDVKYKKSHWEVFQMNRWFDDFYDCESFGYKPKSEIIKTIMNKYPGKYIVVGDRKSDMECARACSGKFIGCTYGYGSDEELKGAEALADSIEILPQLLKCISK